MPGKRSVGSSLRKRDSDSAESNADTDLADDALFRHRRTKKQFFWYPLGPRTLSGVIDVASEHVNALLDFVDASSSSDGPRKT